MVLFSTLKAASSSSKSSSLSLPTMMQLYVDTPLGVEQANSRVCQMPSYAVLTYQAVPTAELLADNAAGGGLAATSSSLRIKKDSFVPDLGVWNCRITPDTSGGVGSGAPGGGADAAAAGSGGGGGGKTAKDGPEAKVTTPLSPSNAGNTGTSAATPAGDAGGTAGGSKAANVSLTDAMLQIPRGTGSGGPPATAFCMTITLGGSDQSRQVEPHLTRMQEALVRYLIARKEEFLPPPQVGSTTAPATPSGDAAPVPATAEEGAEGAAAGDVVVVDDPITAAASLAAYTSSKTTLAQLKKAQFGLAPNDAASKTNTAPIGGDDEDDKRVAISLMICVKLANTPATAAGGVPTTPGTPSAATTPTSKGGSATDASGAGGAAGAGDGTGAKPEDDYATKQAEQLMLYHLRRYAFALNASLAFCHEGHPLLMAKNNKVAAAAVAAARSGAAVAAALNNLTDPPSLTLGQTAVLWRALAQGQSIWKDYPNLLELPSNTTTADDSATAAETAEAADTGDAENANDDVHALVYGPGCYQEDLIETVLLRNAQYPGHWDAAQESVWKIFPTDDSAENPLSSSSASPYANQPHGDQLWLDELRQSIAGPTPAANDAAGGLASPNKKADGPPSSLSTPEPKKKADGDKPAAGQQTPNDAAAFFESLLK